MNLAVLMTCHNRVDTTLACLRRLMPQLGEKDGVYLVDDGSTDGTGARVRVEHPTVHVIDADGSLYWSKGMHVAWKAAIASGKDYDFYLWLNDDVMLNPGAIDALLSDWTKSADTRSVIVGACAQDEAETQSSYAATDVHDIRYEPNGRSPQRATGWFNGNVVLVPCETCRRVGVISKDYSHSRGDYDYAERLRRAGIPFWASSRFAGHCADTAAGRRLPPSIAGRFLALFKPGNYNLRDLWLYRRRHWGWPRALLSSFHLVCIVLFRRGDRNG